MNEVFLYLITTGRKTGQPRSIEIWFVEYENCFYLVAEGREQAHWVRNIEANPNVQFSIGDRENHNKVRAPGPGIGRAIHRDIEPTLAAAVAALMDAKYDWSEGLIVEIQPL